MMDRAKAARVTMDPHVIRRVAKDHSSAFFAHQGCEIGRLEGIAAHHAMTAEEPQIAEFADRRARREFGQIVGRVILVVGQVLE
jgi:hypothetical protein